MSLLIPKLQELKPMGLHNALSALKDKMKMVENIGSGIYSNLDVMEQMILDYDDIKSHNSGAINTNILDGLVTSVRMHTDHIETLLYDVTKSFNIHDIEESEGGTV